MVHPTQAVFEALHRGFSRGLEEWETAQGGTYSYHFENPELGSAAGLQVQVDEATASIRQAMLLTVVQTHALFQRMNDADVDAFTAACELWRQGTGTKPDWVYVPFADVLELSGIQPQDGGLAYRVRDRFKVQEGVLRLGGTQCYEVPLSQTKKVTRRRKGQSEQDFILLQQVRLSPVLMIRDRVGTRVVAGQEDTTTGRTVVFGEGIVLDGVELQPGPLLARYLLESPEEWALLATRALQYKDTLQVVEKRLTRYLGLIFRRRFKLGSRSVRVTVQELVDVAGLPTDSPRRPKEYKDRLEKALNTLCQDRVIGELGWSYEDWDDATYGLLEGQRPRHRWYETWLQQALSVTIEDAVYDVYWRQGIQALSTPGDDGALKEPVAALTAPSQPFWTPEAVRALRVHLKMGQRDFADALGVSRGFVCMLENGQRGITDETAKKLNRLVALKLAELTGEQFDQVAASVQEQAPGGGESLQLSWLNAGMMQPK